MRVLFLASYFPKPGNTLIGPWALLQAQALQRTGIDLRTVSFTSWVPRWLARSRGAKVYANCPAVHEWDGLRVEYPRWLYYPIGRRLRVAAQRNPRWQMQLAWQSAKPVMSRVLSTWRPDVIYAHHTFPNGYVAWRLFREHKVPYVITNHSFDDITDCERFPERRRLFGQIADSAYAMVAVSRRMKRDTVRLFPSSRNVVVPNGVDISLAPSRQGKAPCTENPVLFSCGAMYERKGFPFLIEAFAQVRQRFPTATLRLAGDGAERALVEQTIQRLGLGDAVKLLGFLPSDRVRAEMVRADMFVLLGWDEPFGVVFAEAMSCATPIVVSDDCGICDLIEDRVHGRTFRRRDLTSAVDAICESLADKSFLSSAGVAGRHLVETKLSWDAVALEMFGIFRGAAATTAGDH